MAVTVSAGDDATGGTPTTPDAAAVARLAADAMWERDAASQSLGMVLEHVGPGEARLRMTVRPDMLNGVGTCHGGLVFALADSAFAFACNSGNEVTVAAACDVSFLLPARSGDVLLATAAERYRSGRNGITDVTVRRQSDAAVVAEFRGRSRTVGGHLVDPVTLTTSLPSAPRAEPLAPEPPAQEQ